MPMAGLSIGPIAALDYAHAKVDGYSEAGDPALTLNVGSQSYSSLTGQIGLEARASVGGFSPFLAATVEHEFTGDDRLITFAQTTSPAIVNSWNVTRDKETYGRLSGGLRASLGGMLSLDANVSSTIGRDGGQELGAQIGVKTAF
jgi:outer membrane autotransporter protein